MKKTIFLAVLAFILLINLVKADFQWQTKYSCNFNNCNGDCSGWSSATCDSANGYLNITGSWCHVRNTGWNYTIQNRSSNLLNLSGEVWLDSGVQNHKFNFNEPTGSSSNTRWIYASEPAPWEIKDEGTNATDYTVDLLDVDSDQWVKFSILINYSNLKSRYQFCDADNCAQSTFEEFINGIDYGFFSIQCGNNPNSDIRYRNLKLEEWVSAGATFADEGQASAAIGTGVQNSLLSGYTNYTYQQVYGRSLNNSQFLGTFDWMARTSTKVWLFNYITSGESHIANTFNLTPSVYVRQIANLTQAQITLEVEQLINSTR